MEASKLKLNLAVGNKPIEGFYGVDITLEGTKADAVEDLETYPWSFDSDSVEEIICEHYIEHTSDLIKFMNEVHRVLKKGGTVTFVSPYYTSVRCWQDPTHKRAISEETYFYFSEIWREREGLAHYPITTNFEVVKFDYHIHKDFQNIHGEDLLYASRHFFNVYDDIRAILKKL